jgi:hypothetical protein
MHFIRTCCFKGILNIKAQILTENILTNLTDEAIISTNQTSPLISMFFVTDSPQLEGTGATKKPHEQKTK